MATLGSQGITFGDGSSLRTTPFRHTHQFTSAIDCNAGNRTYTDITSTPDWTIPAKARCHLYYYVPVRNDTQSWGGMYSRLLYRINSGSWIDMGDSGYSSVMITSSYSISYYGNSFNFNFESLTSDFTLGFLVQGAPYDGNARITGSNDVGNGVSTGVSNTNGSIQQNNFYTKLILTGDAPV